MSRAWHCDGIGCDTWTRGLGLDGWVMVGDDLNFCGWGCVAGYAANQPWVETVEVIGND